MSLEELRVANLPDLPEGFTTEPYVHSGYRILRAGVYVGAIFPGRTAEPDGPWMARRYAKAARACKDRAEAVRHITEHLVREIR